MELDKVFQVSEFNEFISTYLESVGPIVIEGEIGQLKISQNRWVFGTVKDDKASVDMFGTVFQIVNIRDLEEGMLVKIYGTPRLYQKTGRFSVSVTKIVPSGEGALKKALEKLRARLEKEGLFDVSRKRRLPRFPQKIGLITAKGSQAYNDFVKVLAERMGGIKVVFTPVSVQGVDSPETIVAALEFLNKTRPGLDLVVITRGGGSLEDLMGFNDERVVRAVFASKIPVVSAVGHEGDWSLVDLAADLRASTPSNAAELIVPSRGNVLNEIEHMMSDATWRVRTRLSKANEYVDESLRSIKAALDKRLGVVNELITTFERQLAAMRERLRAAEARLDGLTDLLGALDVRTVLKRGFTLTYTADGRLLRSIKDVSVGAEFTTRFADGVVDCVADTIQSSGD